MDRFIEFVTAEWMLFTALFIVLGLLLRNALAPKLSGVKDVDTNQAIRMLNDEKTVVVDVRLDGEFKSGHILHAVNIPVGALESRIRELEKHKTASIIVSCQSGNRSRAAAQILRKHGFNDVFNLAGGMAAWTTANLPIAKGDKSKKG